MKLTTLGSERVKGKSAEEGRVVVAGRGGVRRVEGDYQNCIMMRAYECLVEAFASFKGAMPQTAHARSFSRILKNIFLKWPRTTLALVKSKNIFPVFEWFVLLMKVMS